jgi:hypothetical protein
VIPRLLSLLLALLLLPLLILLLVLALPLHLLRSQLPAGPIYRPSCSAAHRRRSQPQRPEA